MDFTNPYTVTLLPNPMDYWVGCAHTTLCDAKCAAEVSAFEDEKSRLGNLILQNTTYKV